jgi:hypothetical protein
LGFTPALCGALFPARVFTQHNQQSPVEFLQSTFGQNSCSWINKWTMWMLWEQIHPHSGSTWCWVDFILFLISISSSFFKCFLRTGLDLKCSFNFFNCNTCQGY